MSKPDVCHANQRECKMQNVDSTYFLLKAAAPYKPYFLYVSTDFVFGENGPHDENEKPAPLNYYGETNLFVVYVSTLTVPASFMSTKVISFFSNYKFS